MKTLNEYLEVPWTVDKTVERRPDGSKRIIGRIKELEGFKVIGRNEPEFERNFWDGLYAFLESMLEDGEEPPLPEGYKPVEPPERRTGVMFVGGPASGSRPDDFTESKETNRFLAEPV